MRLTCPHCGTRDSREFTYRGADLSRPPASGAFGAAWDAYLHLRENPAGATAEQWYHDPCGTWIVVHRDTTSHAVHGSALPGGAAR